MMATERMIMLILKNMDGPFFQIYCEKEYVCKMWGKYTPRAAAPRGGGILENRFEIIDPFTNYVANGPIHDFKSVFFK